MISTSADTPPFRDRLFENDWFVARAWQAFFRRVSECLKYFGQERYYPLTNNLAVAADVTPLKFDLQLTTVAFIDYVIQRQTSTTEKNQSGILKATYQAKAQTWHLAEYGTSGPDAAGITFTITALGQIQYTSTNLGGTEVLSRIVFRTRELAAKAYYSKVG